MCWPTFSNPRSTTATRAAIADCVGGARPLMHLVASVRADSAEGCGKSFLAAGPPEATMSFITIVTRSGRYRRIEFGSGCSGHGDDSRHEPRSRFTDFEMLTVDGLGYITRC